MQIETILSFKQGTFHGNDFVNLVKFAIDFDIKKFSVDEIRDTELNYHEKYLSKISKCTHEAELIFRTDNKSAIKDEQFWIMESAHPKSPQTLYWFLNDRYVRQDVIIKLTSNTNFTTGYICDADFLLWQNEKSISNYQYYGKDHNLLPKLFNKDFNMWEIDIKKINPGRSVLVSDMWLQSSFIMLFGQASFNMFSKEKLLSFQKAYQVMELPNGVVWIQLYRDLNESNSPDSLQVMKDFREWIEMDNLENKLQ
jgi:hypothetical protein